MTRVIVSLVCAWVACFGVVATLMAWKMWQERRRARRLPATCGLCLAPMYTYTNDLYCWPCDVAVRAVRAMARTRRPA